MPTYPPRNNPTRKMEILDRRIHDFFKCVRNESSIEKLKNMAEKVKVAKLNLIKARLKLLQDYKEESRTKPKQELKEAKSRKTEVGFNLA